ncbi:MAG: hypothetical protein QOF51_4356 [Chloroflexota bacterium]|nr:hypothetical protein [Chloroflexota bacterium]
MRFGGSADPPQGERPATELLNGLRGNSQLIRANNGAAIVGDRDEFTLVR